MAITGDEHMLAELMLPDQAHMRNQDWTIFFLHKDTSQEEEDQESQEKAERRRRRKRRRDIAAGIILPDQDDAEDYGDSSEDDDLEDDDSEDDEPEGSEGPPLVYVLNLVNTKQDKTVKRGAVVKAMAICTRHPFLHIYKVSPQPQNKGHRILCHRGMIFTALIDNADPFTASFIIGTGRVFQVTSTRDFSHAL